MRRRDRDGAGRMRIGNQNVILVADHPFESDSTTDDRRQDAIMTNRSLPKVPS
jgi:hypothetical protein